MSTLASSVVTRSPSFSPRTRKSLAPASTASAARRTSPRSATAITGTSRILRAQRREKRAALLLAVALEVVEQDQVARLPGQALDELARRADDLDFGRLH